MEKEDLIEMSLELSREVYGPKERITLEDLRKFHATYQDLYVKKAHALGYCQVTSCPSGIKNLYSPEQLVYSSDFNDWEKLSKNTIKKYERMYNVTLVEDTENKGYYLCGDKVLSNTDIYRATR